MRVTNEWMKALLSLQSGTIKFDVLLLNNTHKHAHTRTHAHTHTHTHRNASREPKNGGILHMSHQVPMTILLLHYRLPYPAGFPPVDTANCVCRSVWPSRKCCCRELNLGLHSGRRVLTSTLTRPSCFKASIIEIIELLSQRGIYDIIDDIGLPGKNIARRHASGLWVSQSTWAGSSCLANRGR